MLLQSRTSPLATKYPASYERQFILLPLFSAKLALIPENIVDAGQNWPHARPVTKARENDIHRCHFINAAAAANRKS